MSFWYTDCPRTAAMEWSGFVYQGKVAIYHVLQVLKTSGDCPGYVLQLDSLEDFAILKNGELESLHQVKARKLPNLSTYQKALAELKAKADTHKCGRVYFHVAREITGKTLQEIEDEFRPVSIYRYDRDPWCAVDDIDRRIENRVTSILTDIFPSDKSKGSGEYAARARGYLDQLILKQLLIMHGMVHRDQMVDCQAAFTQTIPFSDFSALLRADLNQKECGEDYYFYVLLTDLHRYYQEYCLEYEDHLSPDEKKKLSWCMLQIENLEYAGLVRFIRNIMPHRDFKFKSLCDYKDHTFGKDEIQQAFLAALHVLNRPEISPNRFFRWQTPGKNKAFAPTTINAGPSLDRTICKRIIANASDNDLDILFEGNHLVTTDIDVPSIVDRVPRETMVDNPGNNRAEWNNHITKWKHVSLVSLDKAKGEING
jgi:hypothetical protein